MKSSIFALVALLVGQVILPVPDKEAVKKEPAKTAVKSVPVSAALRGMMDGTLKRYGEWGIEGLVVTATSATGCLARAKVDGVECVLGFVLTTEADRPMEVVPLAYVEAGGAYLLRSYGRPTKVIRCKDIWVEKKGEGLEWKGCQMVFWGDGPGFVGEPTGKPASGRKHLCLSVVVDGKGKVTEVKEFKPQ